MSATLVARPDVVRVDVGAERIPHNDRSYVGSGRSGVCVCVCE